LQFAKQYKKDAQHGLLTKQNFVRVGHFKGLPSGHQLFTKVLLNDRRWCTYNTTKGQK